VSTPYAFRLTPKEQQIVTALRRGDTTRQIADAHGLGRQTVKNYLTTIYEKLGVTGRVELQQAATVGGRLSISDTLPPCSRGSFSLGGAARVSIR
jgi:DNA-binding CsgD family transcriptional regulator